MSKHFQKCGDEYLLSPAAVLLITSDALRSPDTTAAGKERSLSVINQVMAVARGVRFEQASAAEALLLFGGDPASVLAACEAIVQHIGGWAVVAIVRRVAATTPPGSRS